MVPWGLFWSWKVGRASKGNSCLVFTQMGSRDGRTVLSALTVSPFLRCLRLKITATPEWGCHWGWYVLVLFGGLLQICIHAPTVYRDREACCVGVSHKMNKTPLHKDYARDFGVGKGEKIGNTWLSATEDGSTNSSSSPQSPLQLDNRRHWIGDVFLGVANPGQCTAWAMSSLKSVFCQGVSSMEPLRCTDSRVLKDFASFPFRFGLSFGSILEISFQLAHLPHIFWWYFFFHRCNFCSSHSVRVCCAAWRETPLVCIWNYYQIARPTGN